MRPKDGDLGRQLAGDYWNEYSFLGFSRDAGLCWGRHAQEGLQLKR